MLRTIAAAPAREAFFFPSHSLFTLLHYLVTSPIPLVLRFFTGLKSSSCLPAPAVNHSIQEKRGSSSMPYGTLHMVGETRKREGEGETGVRERERERVLAWPLSYVTYVCFASCRRPC